MYCIVALNVIEGSQNRPQRTGIASNPWVVALRGQHHGVPMNIKLPTSGWLKRRTWPEAWRFSIMWPTLKNFWIISNLDLIKHVEIIKSSLMQGTPEFTILSLSDIKVSGFSHCDTPVSWNRLKLTPKRWLHGNPDLNKVGLTHHPYPLYCIQKSICISCQILTTCIAYRRERRERERGKHTRERKTYDTYKVVSPSFISWFKTSI